MLSHNRSSSSRRSALLDRSAVSRLDHSLNSPPLAHLAPSMADSNRDHSNRASTLHALSQMVHHPNHIRNRSSHRRLAADRDRSPRDRRGPALRRRVDLRIQARSEEQEAEVPFVPSDLSRRMRMPESSRHLRSAVNQA
ncbi:peptide synthetase [Pseudozyma hubeiensis SY62]|uniref:Peptide synthetase n=1 Tax=Pseudozyma hubeiensis (strain SY62) TaxID=1305764 RepID=R9P6T7_PSEHS|nr:peptide synthetase [Pseudozyma hubeiensis SY62]GAC93795.1 peptide synthetase [Pseudozyma hubeiensis SY62]